MHQKKGNVCLIKQRCHFARTKGTTLSQTNFKDHSTTSRIVQKILHGGKKDEEVLIVHTDLLNQDCVKHDMTMQHGKPDLELITDYESTCISAQVHKTQENCCVSVPYEFTF